ncbi:TPA: transposase [Vibrio parahaemolyticus]
MDGHWSIDNNSAERVIKLLVIDRKHYGCSSLTQWRKDKRNDVYHY